VAPTPAARASETQPCTCEQFRIDTLLQRSRENTLGGPILRGQFADGRGLHIALWKTSQYPCAANDRGLERYATCSMYNERSLMSPATQTSRKRRWS